MSRKQVYIACVTGQYNCERIIAAASCIAQDAGASLEIVSVLNGCSSEESLEALEYLHGIAKAAGARMTILYNDNPVLAVTEYIKHIKAPIVITGVPGADTKNNGFISLLSSILPKVKIISIPESVTDNDYDTSDLIKAAANCQV
ncbi:MAG: hypothetical protein J6L81_09425 [Clostridia bacterium]|nr:hypothetical protein [Clostridia bacterium]